MLTVNGCATFYQRTMDVQNNIAKGNFEQANKELENDKKWPENNHRVLYFMNRGMVLFMLGKHEESNYFFNLADYYTEDLQKKLGYEALSLVSNPMVKPYRPEDFESIMIHYYKALNFIALKNYEGALVECRRINIKLGQFNEKYKEHKNKYTRDAFAHNLMGIIYQAAGDYNNAFIAYRNAIEIYENDYSKLFNIEVPQQLKKDILVTANILGFNQELHFYENKFGISVSDINTDDGDLVYIWMNGLGPIKSEWNLNLTNMGVRNGNMIFGSNELGVSFPIFLGNQSPSQKSQLKNLSVIRIAFPKYIERIPMYQSAVIRDKNKFYTLELAQDINKIAFESLNDRLLREIGNNILRLATKQAIEQISRKGNENIGALVGVVNAITEKADTRNWQSLPYALHYTRIPLSSGKHSLKLEQQRIGGGVKTENIEVNVIKGETTFQIYHQLETR